MQQAKQRGGKVPYGKIEVVVAAPEDVREEFVEYIHTKTIRSVAKALAQLKPMPGCNLTDVEVPYVLAHMRYKIEVTVRLELDYVFNRSAIVQLVMEHPWRL